MSTTLQKKRTLAHEALDARMSDWPEALKEKAPSHLDARLEFYEEHKDSDFREYNEPPEEDEPEEASENPEEEPSAEESSEAPTPDEAPDKEYRFQETTDAGW
jgi:hypothetical protein